MTVEEIIARRGITELIHFTTYRGLTGIAAQQQVLSRKRLPEEVYLEHIYKPTWEVRRDGPWLDYVNLSISWINPILFDFADRKHSAQDTWWCALAFDPILLTHDGVWITTTNNIYSGIKRGKGADALEAAFALRVVQQVYGSDPDGPVKSAATRARGYPDNLPTCLQAEVLYPHAVPTSFLRTIYVKTNDHRRRVRALLRAVSHPAVAVIADPDRFSAPRYTFVP